MRPCRPIPMRIVPVPWSLTPRGPLPETFPFLNAQLSEALPRITPSATTFELGLEHYAHFLDLRRWPPQSPFPTATPPMCSAVSPTYQWQNLIHSESPQNQNTLAESLSQRELQHAPSTVQLPEKGKRKKKGRSFNTQREVQALKKNMDPVDLPTKRIRKQWKCPHLSFLAKEKKTKRNLGSIEKLLGYISKGDSTLYLCVMGKKQTAIWRQDGGEELTRLLVLHGLPKEWYDCGHGYRRPIRRTQSDSNMVECPECPSQEVYADSEEEFYSDDEYGDDDDDDGGDPFNLSNSPNCMPKAMCLPQRAVIVLNRLSGSLGIVGTPC